MTNELEPQSNSGDSKPFVKEVTVNASIKKVWAAITDKDEMKNWYFELDEFRPEVGFEFQFEGTGKGGKTYIHLCKITEVIPDKKISYSWRYQEFPGNSLVTFELFPEGEQTKVKLTHEGIENFDANNPDFVKENFVQGWNHIIDISLKEYLEK